VILLDSGAFLNFIDETYTTLRNLPTTPLENKIYTILADDRMGLAAK
jgi:hypothetical protein